MRISLSLLFIPMTAVRTGAEVCLLRFGVGRVPVSVIRRLRESFFYLTSGSKTDEDPVKRRALITVITELEIKPWTSGPNPVIYPLSYRFNPQWRAKLVMSSTEAGCWMMSNISLWKRSKYIWHSQVYCHSEILTISGFKMPIMGRQNWLTRLKIDQLGSECKVSVEICLEWISDFIKKKREETRMVYRGETCKHFCCD